MKNQDFIATFIKIQRVDLSAYAKTIVLSLILNAKTIALNFIFNA